MDLERCGNPELGRSDRVVVGCALWHSVDLATGRREVWMVFGMGFVDGFVGRLGAGVGTWGIRGETGWRRELARRQRGRR